MNNNKIKLNKLLFNKNCFFNTGNFFGDSYILFSKSHFIVPSIKISEKFAQLTEKEIGAGPLRHYRADKITPLYTESAEIKPANSAYKYITIFSEIDNISNKHAIQWKYYEALQNILNENRNALAVVNSAVKDGMIYIIDKNNKGIVSIFMEIKL